MYNGVTSCQMAEVLSGELTYFTDAAGSGGFGVLLVLWAMFSWNC